MSHASQGDAAAVFPLRCFFDDGFLVESYIFCTLVSFVLIENLWRTFVHGKLLDWRPAILSGGAIYAALCWVECFDSGISLCSLRIRLVRVYSEALAFFSIAGTGSVLFPKSPPFLFNGKSILGWKICNLSNQKLVPVFLSALGMKFQIACAVHNSPTLFHDRVFPPGMVFDVIRHVVDVFPRDDPRRLFVVVPPNF